MIDMMVLDKIFADTILEGLILEDRMNVVHSMIMITLHPLMIVGITRTSVSMATDEMRVEWSIVIMLLMAIIDQVLDLDLLLMTPPTRHNNSSFMGIKEGEGLLTIEAIMVEVADQCLSGKGLILMLWIIQILIDTDIRETLEMGRLEVATLTRQTDSTNNKPHVWAEKLISMTSTMV